MNKYIKDIISISSSEQKNINIFYADTTLSHIDRCRNLILVPFSLG